jgi:hypothetical protein
MLTGLWNHVGSISAYTGLAEFEKRSTERVTHEIVSHPLKGGQMREESSNLRR